MNKYLHWLLLIVILIIALLLLYWIIFEVFLKTSVEFQSGSLTALLTIFAIIITRKEEVKKNHQTSMMEKKVEVYKSLIEMFFAYFYAKGKSKEGLLLNNYKKLMPGILTYGSSETIKLWGEFRNLSSDTNISDKTYVSKFESLLLSIREDLGHDNSMLNNNEHIILKTFLNKVDDIYNKDQT